VLLAALFVANFGPGKLLGSEQAVQTFADIGAGQWLRYLIGALDAAGGIGLLVLRLSGLAALRRVAVIAWFRRADTLALVQRLRAGRLPGHRCP
jgi:putative oxidoreductase